MRPYACLLVCLVFVGCSEPPHTTAGDGPSGAAVSSEADSRLDAPALAADLDRQHAPAGGPLALPELSGLYRAPGSTPEQPTLTCVDVEVAEDGSRRITQVACRPWAGMHLYGAGFVSLREGAPPEPPEGVRHPESLRIKVLLYDEQKPARDWTPTARAVLKVGDTVLSDWRDLEQLLQRVAPQLESDGEVIVDGRAGLPARFVLAPLALVFSAETPVSLAVQERSYTQRKRPDGLRDELAAVTSRAGHDAESGLPAVGVRLRVDGRAPWRAVQDVLGAVVANQIPRVTFAVVVDGKTVDLQPVGTDAEGRTVGIREPRFGKAISKPVIVLEEEVQGD